MAVPRLADTLGAAFGPAQRYWGGSGPEWDVVAHCRDTGRHLLGEVKWSAKAATAASLRAAYAQLQARGVPPFVRGEVVRALFVPVLPRERPSGLPEDLVLVDAATLLAAIGDDEG